MYLSDDQMDYALERNIWNLKNVFYSLDPQKKKAIRLDSILAHLANGKWSEGTLVSKLLELPHAPSSQHRDSVEGDEAAEKHFSGKCLPHVCRLLAPQVGLCQLRRYVYIYIYISTS